jgi:hypothetical protein
MGTHFAFRPFSGIVTSHIQDTWLVTNLKNNLRGLSSPSFSSSLSFPHFSSSNLKARLRGLHWISSGRGLKPRPPHRRICPYTWSENFVLHICNRKKFSLHTHTHTHPSQIVVANDAPFFKKINTYNFVVPKFVI